MHLCKSGFLQGFFKKLDFQTNRPASSTSSFGPVPRGNPARDNSPGERTNNTVTRLLMNQENSEYK